MSKLYRLDPEVSGDWGDGTIVENRDRMVSGVEHFPVLSRLVAVFTVWLGDDLVNVDGYLVSDRLGMAIERNGLSGADLRNVAVIASDEFLSTMEHIYPGRVFPAFRWLVPSGTVRYSSAGTASEWSGADFSLGLNDDYPTNLSSDFVGLVPDRYGLVVSERAFDVITQFRLEHCDVAEMKL
jgi:hypothetical protein